MCGEHHGGSAEYTRSAGSSPHVRGARCVQLRPCRQPGIIPACAGSTGQVVDGGFQSRDHPRMCGEHASPAARMFLAAGSSPHVRGAHDTIPASRHSRGIIPACAGSTSWRSGLTCQAWDHPRMCGEHTLGTSGSQSQLGSSPHVRGALTGRCTTPCVMGIIPACAGSTCPGVGRGPVSWDHPRMCGEHTLKRGIQQGYVGSSPHVRGAQRMITTSTPHVGIIPACAGSTAAAIVR